MKRYNQKFLEGKIARFLTGPLEELPKGTKVAVGNKYGKVVKATKEKDQFGMPIMVHEIKYEKIRTGSKMSPEGKVGTFKPINKTSKVNYSAIQILDWE
jgi:hypothetical protein